MNEIERAATTFAKQHRNLVTRQVLLDAGADDHYITLRVDHGHLFVAHAGVYVMGSAPLDWRGRLEAAVLAAGDGAVASHRAAVVLWGLDGIKNAPVEITVKARNRPMPSRVIVHRTRRPIDIHLREGIPVTGIERSLLEAGAFIPESHVEMATESAFRFGFTTPENGAKELHYLTRRQNGLLELGYELRRYDGVYVDRHPDLVARELFPLLKRRPG